MKVGRVIRAAHEWTGSDMRKTLGARDLAVGFESFRRDELDYRQMLRRRPQILAEGQNLAADIAQVVHRLEKFRFGFAETKHHAALGYDIRCKLFGAVQYTKRKFDILRAT